jgi:hypothetical protein
VGQDGGTGQRSRNQMISFSILEARIPPGAKTVRFFAIFASLRERKENFTQRRKERQENPTVRLAIPPLQAKACSTSIGRQRISAGIFEAGFEIHPPAQYPFSEGKPLRKKRGGLS